MFIFFGLELWKLNHYAQNGQYKTFIKMYSNIIPAPVAAV